MAHPKLATVVQRSVLTASAVALMAGPLAAVGAAQTLDDSLIKLTCEEALKTEEAKIIEEFCTAEELEALDSPLAKSVDEVTKTVEGTANEAGDAVAPKKEEPEAEKPTGGGGGGSPTEVLTGGSKDGSKPTGGSKVENTGGDFSGVDERSGANRGREDRTGTKVEAKGFGYNTDGPFRPGMQSNSSLTLQPFAAPLVSVPPVYELPQVAQQLFGTTADATAADPQVAGAAGTTTATSASQYETTGYSATAADPTGWLAATATGLIMLVGAGHALNGGRKPSRSKA